MPLETLIFEDESGVKVRRLTNKGKPSNTDADHVESEENNKTPRPQASHVSEAIELSDSEEPYITPTLLTKKMRKVVAPSPNDTELEESEVEQKMREKMSKKTSAVKTSSDKVR